MTKSRVWFAVVPTEPDVRRLLDTFGVPEQGMRIAYADVATLLGVAVGSPRFREVTRVWRKRLAKENNLIVGCDPGAAFVVLTDAERLDTGCRRFSSGLRIVRRSVGVVSGCDDRKLDAAARQRKEHTVRVGSHLLFVAREEARKRGLPAPCSAPVTPACPA